MPGLILEGLTGSGKSTLFDGLSKHPRFETLLGGGPALREEETFGELMNDLRDPKLSDIDRCRRLRRVVQRLASAYQDSPGKPPGFLLERFHPSYYALMPTWKLYAYMDEALERVGGRLVLLTYPSAQFRERALAKPGGEGLEGYYGSEAAALEALKLSQERRLEFLGRTRLPYLTIDTADGRFEDAVRRVVDFWESGR